MDSQRKNPYRNYYYTSTRTAKRQPVTRGGARPSPVTPPPRRHRHWFRRLAALICLIVLFVVGINLAKDHHLVNSITSHVPKLAISSPKVVTKPPVDLTNLTNQINTIIQNNSAIDFSVSITDLSNDQGTHIGDTAPFTAASVTKLITACDFLKEVENGQQTLSETVNGSSAEYELQQMIVVSDDNAWDALNNILGYSQLQSYANSIGLASFQSVANTITSDNIASLLQQLYHGQLLNNSDTNLLMGWLKQANYRTYIVPAVPSSDVIYHKIGLYEDFVNDAAIITRGNQAIVLVIFTNGNGTYNWPMRAQLMQQIATDTLTTYGLD